MVENKNLFRKLFRSLTGKKKNNIVVDFQEGLRQLKYSRSSANRSPETDLKEEGRWVLENIVSKYDKETKLATQVFFASFDQTSKEAGGFSACAAIAALIANWFISNPQKLIPTKDEFDRLIKEGSSIWQTLRDNNNNEAFPDNHFPLDTIIESNLVPLTLSTDNSLTGAFSPEKFESIKGLKSFDEIWNKLNSEPGPGVYIVSWNDHFFVVKIGVEAHYLIESVGERLRVGCNQAYILRFNESSLMTQKGEAIFGGKECLREYIKRFLAAIFVRMLETRGDASVTCILQKLQIDFHCCDPAPTD